MGGVGSGFWLSRENSLVVARPASCCDRMRSGEDGPTLGRQTIGRRERIFDLQVEADEGETRFAVEAEPEGRLGFESRF